MSTTSLEPVKQLLSSIGQERCQRKGCLSENRGGLDIVWFGRQYETKEMTCSCCYVMNDQAIKKSLPTGFNVMPLLKFSDRLLEEYRLYEEKKRSSGFYVVVMREKHRQIIEQLNTFQTKLTMSLSSLVLALEGFLKKVQTKNKQIYHNETFEQIIELKRKNTFEELIQRVNQLVGRLNYCQLTGDYEFEKIEVRNKRLEKEREKIQQVISKVEGVMGRLFADIRKRNEAIAKI